MEIKDKVKNLRKNKGWTIAILAEKAKIGQVTISQIERGRNKPSADVLEKLADAFGVSTDYLLGREKNLTTVSNIQDKDLFWQFQEIDKLDKKDKGTVKEFLDAFLMKKAHKKSSKK